MAEPAMTGAPYDYDANCRAWPEARGPFPIGTLEDMLKIGGSLAAMALRGA